MDTEASRGKLEDVTLMALRMVEGATSQGNGTTSRKTKETFSSRVLKADATSTLAL